MVGGVTVLWGVLFFNLNGGRCAIRYPLVVELYMKKTICWGLNRFFMEGYRTDLNCGFLRFEFFF